jgi:dihydrofolate reductase
MSLDGFVAGPNDGPGSPLGDGGERLFAWYSGGDTDRIQAAWYRDGVRGLVAQRPAPSGGARQNGRVRDGAQDVRHRQRLGWQPPLGVPTFVVNHAIPQE